MDTPRLLPQPPLFLEGLRPVVTLPLYQEGVGGCVNTCYIYIFNKSFSEYLRKFVIFYPLLMMKSLFFVSQLTSILL